MNSETTKAAIRSSADTVRLLLQQQRRQTFLHATSRLGHERSCECNAAKIEKVLEEKRKEAAEAKRAMNHPENVKEWTCKDVQRWLDMPMPGQYKKAFMEARVDGEFLMEITAADMRDVLGMEHRLHIKKVLTMREKLETSHSR